MPNFKQQQFCLSTSQHGLRTADEAALSHQQQQHLMHLLHAPPPAAALPCRYYTSNPGFLFPQRSDVPKQVFGFSPMFSLAQSTTSSSR